MQTQISARGTKLTPAIRQYVQGKVDKLNQFFNGIQKIEVVLEAHKIDNIERRQMAELRLWVSGLKFIEAKEAGRDLYAAIDLAEEEAKRQLQRHKKMLVDEQRRKAAREKRKQRKKIGYRSGDSLNA
ncbi:MAG: ribosome-associated translation inhibitor RaiA [Candidatus Margulisbacteria bacterium]|nr:ribosome-associated translation inhibitor RaiA [Candidatus Margulisiibacteriota bacterium]